MMTKILSIGIMIAGIFFVCPVWAQEGSPEFEGEIHRKSGEPDSPDQKRLETLRERWKALSPERQAELNKRFESFQSLPPEDRALLMDRFKKFQRLSPETKMRLRENHRRWKALPESRRQEFRKNFETFREMPPEQRRELREQFQERKRKDRLHDRHNRFERRIPEREPLRR